MRVRPGLRSNCKKRPKKKPAFPWGSMGYPNSFRHRNKILEKTKLHSTGQTYLGNANSFRKCGSAEKQNGLPGRPVNPKTNLSRDIIFPYRSTELFKVIYNFRAIFWCNWLRSGQKKKLFFGSTKILKFWFPIYVGNSWLDFSKANTGPAIPNGFGVWQGSEGVSHDEIFPCLTNFPALSRRNLKLSSIPDGG